MHSGINKFLRFIIALTKGDISANSLFMRFTTAKKTFTEKELDYFTRMDYQSHNGLGVVLDKPGYPGVGTARYFVDADDPTTAEWAVTVVDQFHGQGIGVILFYSICVVSELYIEFIYLACRDQWYKAIKSSSKS